jgi:hypothetical protein
MHQGQRRCPAREQTQEVAMGEGQGGKRVPQAARRKKGSRKREKGEAGPASVKARRGSCQRQGGKRVPQAPSRKRVRRWRLETCKRGRGDLQEGFHDWRPGWRVQGAICGVVPNHGSHCSRRCQQLASLLCVGPRPLTLLRPKPHPTPQKTGLGKNIRTRKY